MAPRKIIITGVNGFLGQYCARAFNEAGWQVIGTGRSEPVKAITPALHHYTRTEMGSAEFAGLLSEAKPEALLHCAGHASVPLSIQNPKADFEAGPVLTKTVLEKLHTHSPATRLVFFSSAAVYGNPQTLPVTEEAVIAPISPYGENKYESERHCVEYAKNHAMPIAILRIFSAYGPGLRRQVMWDICQKIEAEQGLVLQGTGHETRDFIHAKDVANAARCVVDKAPMKGEAYNVACGQAVKIEEIARLIAGKDHSIRFDNALPQGTPKNWQADIARLKNLGFEPAITLKDGIAEYVRWKRQDG